MTIKTNINADTDIMRLVHYFVTKESYTPMIVKGVQNEIWLQNIDAKYKIIRINANSIINNEQYEYDLLKLNNVSKQVKRKTLSFTIDVLNILLDVSPDVELYDVNHFYTVYIDNLANINDERLLKIFPDINNNLLLDEDGIELFLNITNDINDKTMKENKLYEKIFKEKKIVVTNILIFINVAVFFITYLLSGGNLTGSFLANVGGVFTPYILNGEWYRLITGGFLHGGFLHLIFNMYALYIIGSQLENFIGKKKFLIVYLYSLICGNLMAAIINPLVVCVGASGAIFGLMGSILYFGYRYRLYLGSVFKTQIVPVILINLLFGFMSSGVANEAHIGGLIGGFLISYSLGVQGIEDKSIKLNGVIVSLIYIGFLIYMLYFR